jgi:predicted dehydrogenase
MSSIRFAAIGINHFHIYGQVDLMLRAGAEFVAFHAPEDDLAKTFAEYHPQAKRVEDPRRILEDKSIALVLSASIPSERAPLGVLVMRHGKDFMVDKPGITSLAQLAEVKKAQAETKRIYSVCYSEHFETRSTVKAGELVHGGAIGKLVNTVALGPHRHNKPRRAPWFYERAKYGGILADIASHQCEQFLFFTDTLEAEIVSATVANRGNPETPELQDFGEILLRTRSATGYVRVDWFTPDGLPTWGDGRLTLVGTDGYMELRKYVDIAGKPGIDHLIMVDKSGVHRIDCTGVELPYGSQLVHDILNRTQTAMPQARCFRATELALTAQAIAERAMQAPRPAGVA